MAVHARARLGGGIVGRIDLALAGIDAAKLQLVGIRVLVAHKDLAHDDVAERRRARAGDLLDFETEQRERTAQLVDRGVEGDVILEPVE